MDLLEIPLTYQGGKQRIAGNILDIISKRNSLEEKIFFDFCCGSGAVTIEAINRNLPFKKYGMLDWSVWGDFWKAIGEGNFILEIFKTYIDALPPKEKIQKYLQDMSNENPNDGIFLSHVYRYLLLQAGSFGGKQIWIEDNKWKNNSFRSYWLPTKTSNRKSPVNPMMPMPDTLYKRIEILQKNLKGIIRATNDNIINFTTFKDNSIIYVDPPYSKTTRYGNKFDVVEWAKKVKQNCNVKIYISEQKALGENSFLIAEKRTKGNISGNNTKGVEEWLTEF